MSIIKAIETKYNGYKFRSRLEAKWAVFFDNAKIKYEYEPEGYEDENGKAISWGDPRTKKIRSKTFSGVAKAMAEQWAGENIRPVYQQERLF